MELAGLSVSHAIKKEFLENENKEVLIVVGPGNNGKFKNYFKRIIFKKISFE